MTEEEKQLIIHEFVNNRKGFYAWLFRNKSRKYLVDALREMFPKAETDLERVYWLVFDFQEPPRCPMCGKFIKFRGGKGSTPYGYNAHCCHECGVQDPHHQNTIKQTKLDRYGDENWNNSQKCTETCKKKYGGNGIRGDRDKAKKTMVEKYGVEYYTSSKEINDMRNSRDIQNKIQNSKREHKTFNTSLPEKELYLYLCGVYGEDDVARQYKDERYPFNCDFYISSKDLFIELNLFPTHGTEPFDENNIEHLRYLEHCRQSPANWIEEQIPKIWAGTDVVKYKIAKQHNLNYVRIYDLKEFINNEKSKS